MNLEPLIITKRFIYHSPELMVKIKKYGIRKLAKAMNLSPSSVHYWVTGKTNIKEENYQRLIKILNRGIK